MTYTTNVLLCQHAVRNVGLPSLMRSIVCRTAKSKSTCLCRDTRKASSVCNKCLTPTSGIWKYLIMALFETAVSTSGLDMLTLDENCTEYEWCIKTSSTLTLIWKAPNTSVVFDSPFSQEDLYAVLAVDFFTSSGFHLALLSSPSLEVNGIIRNNRFACHGLCIHNSSVRLRDKRFGQRFTTGILHNLRRGHREIWKQRL